MADLNWLITAFADKVPAVAHAVVVSSDGLPLAFSEGLPPDRVDQMAAVTSGLTSLTQGAARIFGGGPVAQTIVEMRRGLLIVMAVSDGCALGVLTTADCDMGLVVYEMALLAERAANVMSPQARATATGGRPGPAGSWPGPR